VQKIRLPEKPCCESLGINSKFSTGLTGFFGLDDRMR
jgi:hypothetical protein